MRSLLNLMPMTLGLGTNSAGSTTMTPSQFDALAVQDLSGYTSAAGEIPCLYQGSGFIGSIPPSKAHQDPQKIFMKGPDSSQHSFAQIGAGGGVVGDVGAGATVFLAGDRANGQEPANGLSDGVTPVDDGSGVSAHGNINFPPASGTPIPADRIKVTKNGAIAVMASDGEAIVVRLPMDTQKDLMKMGIKAKAYLITDELMLRLYDGRHRNEQEGPFFKGFFWDNKTKSPTVFIVSSHIKPHADAILRGSYEPPSKEELEAMKEVYPDGEATAGYPNFLEETRHYFNFKTDVMRRYEDLDYGGEVEIGNMKVMNRGNGVYTFYEKVEEGGEYRSIGDVDLKLDKFKLPSIPKPEDIKLSPLALKNREEIFVNMRSAYIPISSGGPFTGEGNSGHMLVRNGEAILFDPPHNIVEILAAWRIPVSAIKQVIITHRHIDHAGGLWALVSHARHEITVSMDPVTTMKVVDMIYHSSLGNISRGTIKKMLGLDKPRYLRYLEPWESETGLWFKFNHGGLHPSPSTGYVLYDRKPSQFYGSRSVVSFSGDSQFNPAEVGPLVNVIDKETGRPVIASYARLNDIINSPLEGAMAGALAVWDGGVFPLHATAKFVAGLAASSVFPPGSMIAAFHLGEEETKMAGIRYMGAGLENAIFLDEWAGWNVPPEHVRRDILLKRAIDDVSIFRGLTMDQKRRLMKMGTFVPVQEGMDVVVEGEVGEKMYVIVDGIFDVRKRDGESYRSVATMTSDLFGEKAFDGGARSATVTAKTNAILFELNARYVKPLLKEAGIEERPVDLARSYQIARGNMESGPVVLDKLDTSSMKIIRIYSKPMTFKKGETIIEEGAGDKDIYIIWKGRVKVTSKSGVLKDEPRYREAGEPVGEMAYIEGKPRLASVIADSDEVIVFRIPEKEIENVMDVPEIKTYFMYYAVESKHQNGKS